MDKKIRELATDILEEFTRCYSEADKDCLVKMIKKVIPENAVVLTREEYQMLNYFNHRGEELLKQERKETAEKFAEKVEQAIVDNTYPYFDKDGKPVNIWKATTGFDKIDEIVKEFTGGENGQ